MSLVEEFWKSLSSKGCKVFDTRKGNDKASYFFQPVVSHKLSLEIVPPDTKNVRRVLSRAGNPFMLYVLTREVPQSEIPWWGPTKNTMEFFEKSEVKWGLVLLHESAEIGYWCDGKEALRLYKRWLIHNPSQTGYHLTHPEQLTEFTRFLGLDKLLKILDEL